jgi:hypothetical protein
VPQAVVAIGVVLAVACAAVLVYLDGRYGPVEGGSFGGPTAAHGLVLDDDSVESYRLASEPGTTATFFAALDNDGSHAVRISSIKPPQGVSDVRWSVYHFEPGGNISGVDTPWRSFPATIPAHGTIRVQLTVHRPACPENTQDGGVSIAYDGTLLVSWRSLLRTHATSAKVLPPVRLC